MSLFDDYKAEAQFAHDFPFGVPGEYWHSKSGDILVSEMTEQHIKNCMKLVGEDDDWYPYFQAELNRRNNILRNTRYIDIDKLIKKLNYSTMNTWGKGDVLKSMQWSNAVKIKDNIIDCINELPLEEVVEVKHGKWIKETKFIITDDPDDDGYWRTIYVCSECEREEWRKEPYCHCGAKMDGKEI